MIAEIGERMAERGKLPVEDGEHPRLAGMEDHVVAAKVAVDDPDIVLARRDVVRQPLDQRVHRGDTPGLRSVEHTSELQSLLRHTYAVFCLKKIKKKKAQHTS